MVSNYTSVANIRCLAVLFIVKHSSQILLLQMVGSVGGGRSVCDHRKQQTGVFFPQLIQKLTDVAEECQNSQLKKLKEICEK